MTNRITWATLCGLALGSGACDGGRGEKAAFDAAGAERPVGSTGPDAAVALPDMAAAPDLAIAEAAPDRPLASLNAAARRLVPGRARLVGSHGSACTNQIPASGNGDRWCAFDLPGAAPGSTELWVLNVTAALGGAQVACNGMDANCRRLTRSLWTGEPAGGIGHPGVHRFDGDTLIFSADTPSAPTIFRGPIYAWRPGWDEARRLTGPDGLSCTGHARAEVALCIENPSLSLPLEFSLTAGKLAAAPLKTVARIVPIRPSVQAGAAGPTSNQWSAAFTRDGAFLAYSTGGRTVQERETLYLVKTDDIGDASKIVEVARDVSRWTISTDSSEWYYLRGYNYSTGGDPSGALTMADFPSGATETPLHMGVGSYQLLSDGTDRDRGLGFMQGVTLGKGTFKLLRDRDRPADVIEIGQGVLGGFVSRDLRYTYYSKQIVGGNNDAYIARNDGSGSCTLAATTQAALAGAPFLPGGGLAIWVDKIDRTARTREAWIANPDGCTARQRFSSAGIDFWFPVRDEGLIYSETDGDTAKLSYATITGGNRMGAPVVVQDQMRRLYAVVPGFRGALFAMNRGSAATDGLYLYAFPFQAAATPDAGTTNGGADASVDTGRTTPADGGAATPADGGAGGH